MGTRTTRRVISAALVASMLAGACATSNDGPDAAPTPDPTATLAGDPTLEPVESVEQFSVEPLIRVDQFGYLPGATKVAVIADPENGFNAALDFDAGSTYVVRSVADGSSVFSGEPTAWNGGAVDPQSGDRGWWFDFSSVTEPGEYQVVDLERGVASHRFRIGDDAYDDVLDAALRMFWFNRANTDHPADLAGPWADQAAFVGPGQDTEARAVDDPDNDQTARDLSGGWSDAGDTNKYVTFAAAPVHQLLAAYRTHPERFDDEVGIPESGNGIPDIVDEVAWEIAWLVKMQNPDGGVLTKVGNVEWGETAVPSEDTQPRFYEEACSSATIAAAGMFAHAAVVFDTVPELADEADELRDRALAAWDWYQANPVRDDCDDGAVKAGDADLSRDDQTAAAVVAAVYLLELTGDTDFAATIADGLDRTRPFLDDGLGRYDPHHGDALAFHLASGDATPETAERIAERFDAAAGGDHIGAAPSTGLHRASMPDAQYHWGSHLPMANTGSSNLLVSQVLGIDPDRAERAEAHLGWFHGVNPLGLVMLSNMGDAGAEVSVRELYHYWFGEHTVFDVGSAGGVGPAPGYVVGGPNASYSGAATPPGGQPPQKAYLDENAASEAEPLWEISEPAIYYQAAYIRLLTGVMSLS